MAAFGQAQYIKRVEDDRLLAGTGQVELKRYTAVDDGGTVGSTPAVMNAIMDELWPLGVRSIRMPATPHRVWQAIRGTKR